MSLKHNAKRKVGERPSLFYEISKNKIAYLMALPAVILLILFNYAPMFGVVIAFQDYSPALGVLKSDWVGFDNFVRFFKSPYFMRCLSNTLGLSVYSLVMSFPGSIILALLLNEVKNTFFKKTVQTITYLPHFISSVVVCGMIAQFVSTDGLVNDILAVFGFQRSNLLLKPQLFKTIFVAGELWTGLGWGSIVYLAALSGIDTSLYEAAAIDGAGRFKQVIHVTLPGIAPTIVTMLILRLGGIMSVGFEKIILLYNPATYVTAETISTYVYKKGLLDMNFGYSSAVGLFNSVINLILLLTANKVSRKINETSLW